MSLNASGRYESIYDTMASLHKARSGRVFAAPVYEKLRDLLFPDESTAIHTSS